MNNILTQSPKKLGEILIAQKLITPEELSKALASQQAKGVRLGEILISEGFITEEAIFTALSTQLNIPNADLKKREIQSQALAVIPEDMARKNTFIPIEINEETIMVAMAFPDDVLTIRDITTRTRKKVQIYLATPTEIYNAIDLYYRASHEIENNLTQMATTDESKEEPSAELTAETPIAQSLYLILRQAVRDRASDVHIEPEENRVRIRFRIDGMLHSMYSLPLSTHGALVSRIKILSEMNIAEQRRSQDGQFSIQVGMKDIDIRSATMATIYGERVALRILDKTLSPLTLEEVGFLPEQLEKFRKLLASPFGVILVGGPTGSGKTTTLYASLNQFDRETLNIITIEDPVEYRFTGINQTQINPKAGITFASGLRTILRHDPDVVLVGEIRDRDTASIATQSALTGRLVLATIHANDAISMIFRLLDLGIEPYLIAPTLVGAVSQRMVRRICPYCKIKAEVLSSEESAYLKMVGEKPGTLYKGKGCNMCANTGYRGRVALQEVLVMTENLRRMVLQGSNTDEIRKAAEGEGMISLQHDGMLKVKQGVTTISEVLRSTHSGD